MIGKVTRNANFYSVAKYIFGKPEAEALLENVPEGKTVSEKAASMQFVAARNSRVKRPAYHLSLSPAPEDNLSRGQWSVICSQVLDELGFRGNQVLVGLHHDVKYPNSQKTRTHAHLLINLVDESGKCANTSWDYYKIPQVLRHLEQNHGMQTVTNIGEAGKQHDSVEEYRQQERSPSGTDVLSRQSKGTELTKPVKRSIKRKLQNIIDETLEPGSSFEDLTVAMESRGVEVHPTLQGWWMRYEGISFAGYQLGRKYTLPAILKCLEVEKVVERQPEPNIFEPGTTPILSMKEVFTSSSESLESDEFPKFKDYSQPELTPEQQKDSPVVNDSSQNIEQFSLEDIEVAPGNLIEMMKQQANHLEQSNYIDGRFYTGMFLDVTAHLAEVVEVGREVVGSSQEEQLELLKEEQQEQQTDQNDSDSDEWLADEEALQDFDARLANVIDTEKAQKAQAEDSPDRREVAESLSQFIQTRSAVLDINPNQPIETNLGILRLDSEENTISITQNVTVAKWDEESQKWQINSELAESHKNNVERLLNNQAVDVEGYQFSLGEDEDEHTITFERVRFKALQTDDGWQISDNSLSSEEQNRILRLPQTSEEYARNVYGGDLIDYFQRHAPEQFEGDIGSIHWTANNGSFDRIFEVSKQSDQSHLVEGFDLTQTDDWGNPRKIFSASIEPDASIQCSQCDIPAEDIDRLLSQELSQEPEVPERKKERER